MDIDTARNSVGQLVMSRDSAGKMIASVPDAHGPYLLIKVTRAGLAILQGREDQRVAPSLLDLFEKNLMIYPTKEAAKSAAKERVFDIDSAMDEVKSRNANDLECMVAPILIGACFTAFIKTPS